jgi:putative endonuclease
MYYVYLLGLSDNTIYTGITTDVSRRLEEHRLGKGGHYTKARRVTRILYTEEHPDRSRASKREAEIKSWPRAKKLLLIKNGIA